MALEKAKLSPKEENLLQFDKEKKPVLPARLRHTVSMQTHKELEELSRSLEAKYIQQPQNAPSRSTAATIVAGASAETIRRSPKTMGDMLSMGLQKFGEIAGKVQDFLGGLGSEGLKGLAQILELAGAKDIAAGLRVWAETPGFKLGGIYKLLEQNDVLKFKRAERKSDEADLKKLMELHQKVELEKEKKRKAAEAKNQTPDPAWNPKTLEEFVDGSIVPVLQKNASVAGMTTMKDLLKAAEQEVKKSSLTPQQQALIAASFVRPTI